MGVGGKNLHAKISVGDKFKFVGKMKNLKFVLVFHFNLCYIVFCWE